MSKKFRLKNVDQTRNYFLEEIKHNEFTSKKHQKICTAPNYIGNFLILACTITGCISISAFTSLIIIRMEITSSANGLKICAIAAAIKKYKSKIKKTKKKYDKIVLSATSKLNSREALISKASIDSNISHDESF